MFLAELDSLSDMSSVSSRQRLSERSSLSSITSQGSRHSSDLDSYMELHSIVADMEKATLALNAEQTKTLANNVVQGSAPNVSSAFQPLVNTRPSRQAVNCLSLSEQTQNLMKNVKCMAESLTNSAAKRALTFSNDVLVDKEDSIRYNFEKGEYCDLHSPTSSLDERDREANDLHENLFKPIDTADKFTNNSHSMFKPMATQTAQNSFVGPSSQPLRILTHAHNPVQNNLGNRSEWSSSNSSSPRSASVRSACSSSDRPAISTAALVTNKQQPLQQQKPTKPVQLATQVLPISENPSLPTTQSKHFIPVANPVHQPLHTPLMVDTNMPELHPKAQYMLGKDAKILQPMPLAASHSQLIKYGTKVPMILPPGTVLPQPLIPPEGYDLVAIDAFGRMMPVQYTDVLYEVPPGYMYGYQPFLQNFKPNRFVNNTKIVKENKEVVSLRKDCSSSSLFNSKSMDYSMAN